MAFGPRRGQRDTPSKDAERDYTGGRRGLRQIRRSRSPKWPAAWDVLVTAAAEIPGASLRQRQGHRAVIQDRRTWRPHGGQHAGGRGVCAGSGDSKGELQGPAGLETGWPDTPRRRRRRASQPLSSPGPGSMEPQGGDRHTQNVQEGPTKG